MKKSGSKSKVNKKYTHFAVSKSTGKIVDGWETVSDIESLKYYAKLDLEDMDLKPSDFNILSGKVLLRRGVDPYNLDNWRKTGESMAKGGKVKREDEGVIILPSTKKDGNISIVLTDKKNLFKSGGKVKEGWGSEEDFEELYSLFPDSYSEATKVWSSLSKEQKDKFVKNLNEGDAASEHIADSWLEFVNAKSEEDYWENATNWDEMKEGGITQGFIYSIGGL